MRGLSYLSYLSLYYCCCLDVCPLSSVFPQAAHPSKPSPPQRPLSPPAQGGLSRSLSAGHQAAPMTRVCWYSTHVFPPDLMVKSSRAGFLCVKEKQGMTATPVEPTHPVPLMPTLALPHLASGGALTRPLARPGCTHLTPSYG